MTVKHRIAASPYDLAGKTTKQETIINSFGRTYSRATYVSTGTGTYDSIPILWTVHNYDDEGHLTYTYFSDGTQTLQTWGSCCGLSSETDRTGVTTTYDLYDGLGRLKQKTRSTLSSGGGYLEQPELVTEYSYDASGRPLSETSSGGGLSLSSSRTYDRAGQTISSTDSSLLTTTYTHEYGVSPGGSRKVTATHADDTREVSEYYRDGNLKYRAGTAVVGRYYQYGVNEDGTQWTLVSTGEACPDSPIWSKTTVDALGRVKTEESPGCTDNDCTLVRTHFYNAEGQLARISNGVVDGSSYMADTLYEYDQLGNAVRSGLDLDTDPEYPGTYRVLNADGKDRFTETLTNYQKLNNHWWRVTVKNIWAVDEDDEETLVSEHRERLSGFPTGTIAESVVLDVYDNQTSTVQELDDTYKVIVQTVTYPDASTEESHTRNGLLQKTISRSGLTTGYAYDSLGRQTKVTDPRGNDVETAYYTSGDGAKGKVKSTLDEAGNRTCYTYDDETGRQSAVITEADANCAGKEQYFEYDAKGQLKRIWGDIPYPVEYGYDDYGRRTSMTTYRSGSEWTGSTWPASPPAGDPTQWHYGTDGNSQYLTAKEYADGTEVTYTYLADGRIDTRTWARTVGGNPLTTSYTYDPLTAELLEIDYSDSTPDVSFTSYTRTGQQETIEDAVGTRTFGYNSKLQLGDEDIVKGQYGLYSRLITRNYESTGQNEVPGRYKGFMIGDSGDPDEDYDTSYKYDAYGRIERITGRGLAADYGVKYTRFNNSEMVQYVQFQSSTNTTLATTTRAYESTRDLLDYVQNVVHGDPDVTVSKYDYRTDTLGRRKDVVYTGTAFSQSHLFKWTYNDRSELTGANRHEGTTPDQPGMQMTPGDYDYNYDPIGNRLLYRVDNDASRRWYCANNVNQYKAIDDAADTCPTPSTPVQTFTYDADGNLTGAAASPEDGPMLLSAASVKTHGGAGDFSIPLPLTEPADAGIECRNNGPTRIVLEFSEAVTLTCNDNITLSSGSCTGITSLGSNRYEVAISGATANACLTLTLADVESSTTGKHLVGVDAVKVVVLKGDVDASTAVNTADLSAIQGQLNQALTTSNFRCDVTVDGYISIYDLTATQGNLDTSTSCTLPEQPMHWQYSWDAENRLIGVAPVSQPVVGDIKLTFVYDYRSRRVARQAWHWDGSEWDTDVDDDLKLFVYDEWNVALVLKGSTETVTHQYTWGLDLSGLSGASTADASRPVLGPVHNAGGIGGLLATVETQGTSSTSDDDNYWHFYDGNGNVGQLLEYDATGDTLSTTPAAHYEYDPYGNITRQTGSYADANPFRFSTKWFEADFGIGYWGRRWLLIRLGRWTNPDPLLEHATSVFGSHISAFGREHFDNSLLGAIGDFSITLNEALGSLTDTILLSRDRAIVVSANQVFVVSLRDRVPPAVEVTANNRTESLVYLTNAPVRYVDPLGLDRWVERELAGCHGSVIYEYCGSCYKIEISMKVNRFGSWWHWPKDIVEVCLRGALCATVGGFGVVTKTKVSCPTRPPDVVTSDDEDAALHAKYKDGDDVYYNLWIRNCNHFATCAQNACTGHGLGGGK